MKPISIVLTILFGIASLGVVVWVGQNDPTGLLKQTEKKKTEAPKSDDLPMPKSGPFGKAQIEETSFDFGTKIVGTETEHPFTIKNTGEGKLAIKLGKPSCSCTVGEVTKLDGKVIKQGPFPPGEEVSIEPGESVNIVVRWMMKTETERFRQAVPVFTTDPDQREMLLEIVGVVDTAFYLTPGGFWELGEISRTEPLKAEGLVWSTVHREFALSEIPRDKAEVSVKIVPADANVLSEKNALSGYVVTVEVAPDIPVGLLREPIKLKAHDYKKEGSDVKEESTLDFTVTALRSGPIEVRGSVGAGFNPISNRVIFGSFPAAQGKKAKMNFFVKDMEEDLVVKSIEQADSRVQFKMEKGPQFGKTNTYHVEIEVLPGPPGKHQMEQADILNLKLNHPDAPDFRLLIDYNATK